MITIIPGVGEQLPLLLSGNSNWTAKHYIFRLAEEPRDGNPDGEHVDRSAYAVGIQLMVSYNFSWFYSWYAYRITDIPTWNRDSNAFLHAGVRWQWCPTTHDPPLMHWDNWDDRSSKLVWSSSDQQRTLLLCTCAIASISATERSRLVSPSGSMQMMGVSGLVWGRMSSKVGGQGVVKLAPSVRRTKSLTTSENWNRIDQWFSYHPWSHSYICREGCHNIYVPHNLGICMICVIFLLGSLCKEWSCRGKCLYRWGGKLIGLVWAVVSSRK